MGESYFCEQVSKCDVLFVVLSVWCDFKCFEPGWDRSRQIKAIGVKQ